MASRTRRSGVVSGAFRDRVYAAVRLIPCGRVATYGDVALWCGAPRQARQVGWALHSLPPDLADDVPWQRVINAQGRVSTHPEEYGTRRQIERLRAEGIAVAEDGTLVAGLAAHRWEPEPEQSGGLEVPPEVLHQLEREELEDRRAGQRPRRRPARRPPPNAG
ncbi:MAG TPA: MGMT family protein [Chloroflexota bacterium]|nr:MGMT family protein [Chloroflexota bacterium]